MLAVNRYLLHNIHNTGNPIPVCIRLKEFSGLCWNTLLAYTVPIRSDREVSVQLMRDFAICTSIVGHNDKCLRVSIS